MAESTPSPKVVKIEPFDPTQDSWTLFEMRLKIQFKALAIPDDNQKYQPLANLGREAFATLVSLIAPADPIDKSFTDLATALKNHYNPAPNSHAERYRFSQRSMKEGESIAEFIT